MHLNLPEILPAIGYLGIFGIVFAESGLLVGFFLPGDSLLFTAGFLASQGIFNIVILAAGCFVAAVVGDSVGYAFGRRVGKRIFYREDSLLFHKDNILKAQKFYEKHGKKTIILARFLPVVRTFAPIVAGIGDMHYPTFLTYNIIGGVLWAIGMTVGGYFLGKLLPAELMEKYLILMILVIIIVSMLPTIIHVISDKQTRTHLLALLTKPFTKRLP